MRHALVSVGACAARDNANCTINTDDPYIRLPLKVSFERVQTDSNLGAWWTLKLKNSVRQRDGWFSGINCMADRYRPEAIQSRLRGNLM